MMISFVLRKSLCTPFPGRVQSLGNLRCVSVSGSGPNWPDRLDTSVTDWLPQLSPDLSQDLSLDLPPDFSLDLSLDFYSIRQWISYWICNLSSNFICHWLWQFSNDVTLHIPGPCAAIQCGAGWRGILL